MIGLSMAALRLGPAADMTEIEDGDVHARSRCCLTLPTSQQLEYSEVFLEVSRPQFGSPRSFWYQEGAAAYLGITTMRS